MRILISAFSCQPGCGSEPGVGWGVVTQAARRHEVVVLTNEHNRIAIEQELRFRPMEQVQFVFIGFRGAYERFYRSKFLGYLYYFVWQFWALRKAKRLHARERFDLAHHATYGNSWAPSCLSRLGIPFVWSAGARERTPRSFYPILSRRAKIEEALRALTSQCIGAFTLVYTGARVASVLSSSPANNWPAHLPVRRLLMGALSESELDALSRMPMRDNASFRVMSIGRLHGWKGFALGLMAFARLLRDRPESEYWIVGRGPERRHLERLAGELKCIHRVRFLDWGPRCMVFDILKHADVLLHPSLHEQFGYVVLEAMAAGRPVVSLDVGGCGELVKSGGGIAVPAHSVEQVVSELHQALWDLASNSARRFQLAAQARRAARERWSWASVGEQLELIYQSALQPGHTDSRKRWVVASGAHG